MSSKHLFEKIHDTHEQVNIIVKEFAKAQIDYFIQL